MRERMAEHRANPACAGCHKLMDPVGFSLENYDAVGRWRTAEDGNAIDASGSLPGRQQVSRASSGLQQALLSRPETVCCNIHRKAAHLRIRPRSRILRCPGSPQDRAGRRTQRLSIFVAHFGNRQQHSVSDEEITMIITKKALPRRTFLRGVGATLALPLLDAMIPSLTALAATAGESGAPPGLCVHSDGSQHRAVDSARRGQAHRAVAHSAARCVRSWIRSR